MTSARPAVPVAVPALCWGGLVWSLASPLWSSLHVAKPESEECYQFLLLHSFPEYQWRCWRKSCWQPPCTQRDPCLGLPHILIHLPSCHGLVVRLSFRGLLNLTRLSHQTVQFHQAAAPVPCKSNCWKMKNKTKNMMTKYKWVCHLPNKWRPPLSTSLYLWVALCWPSSTRPARHSTHSSIPFIRQVLQITRS